MRQPISQEKKAEIEQELLRTLGKGYTVRNDGVVLYESIETEI